MPLVHCPDCQTQHSDSAPACPRCARPAASAPTATPPRPVVIEATDKKWKSLQVGGVVLVLLGTAACVAGATSGEPNVAASVVGTLAFVAGFGIVIIAKIKAWWHHG